MSAFSCGMKDGTTESSCTPSPMRIGAAVGSDARPPQTATRRPWEIAAPAVRAIRRNTAGCKASNRDASSGCPRSIASVYCVRSFVPMERKSAIRGNPVGHQRGRGRLDHHTQLDRRGAPHAATLFIQHATHGADFRRVGDHRQKHPRLGLGLNCQRRSELHAQQVRTPQTRAHAAQSQCRIVLVRQREDTESACRRRYRACAGSEAGRPAQWRCADIRQSARLRRGAIGAPGRETPSAAAHSLPLHCEQQPRLQRRIPRSPELRSVCRRPVRPSRCAAACSMARRSRRLPSSPSAAANCSRSGLTRRKPRSASNTTAVPSDSARTQAPWPPAPGFPWLPLEWRRATSDRRRPCKCPPGGRRRAQRVAKAAVPWRSEPSHPATHAARRRSSALSAARTCDSRSNRSSTRSAIRASPSPRRCLHRRANHLPPGVTGALARFRSRSARRQPTQGHRAAPGGRR